MRAIAVLLALATSTFVYVTTETLPIGLLLLIAGDLHTTASAAGLLVTGYGLVVVVTSIPLTHLTRRVPRRHLLTGLLGVFVLATWATAAAPTYGLLLAARVVTALSQALFWSVVVATAAGLFSPAVRGRVIAVVFGGSSLATVAGVPLGTWLGEAAGWRTAFLALSGVGVLTMAVIAALLPTSAPAEGHAARGTAPDARRYWRLMAMTALAATGCFTAFTYVTPFLTEVAAIPLAAIGPLLVVRGVAGLLGVGIGGAIADRHPWAATAVPLVAQSAALLLLFPAGRFPVAAVGLVALCGFAFSALTTGLGSRVLDLAPGSADLASAGASTAVNLGITAGALIGSGLLPLAGVRSTALVGGLLSVAALAVAWPAFRPRPGFTSLTASRGRDLDLSRRRRGSGASPVPAGAGWRRPAR
jgi:DHA1 family inner membrane transport protein